MTLYVYRMFNSKIEVAIVNVVERKNTYALIYEVFGETRTRRIWKKSEIGRWNTDWRELPMVERDDNLAREIMLNRIATGKREAQEVYESTIESLSNTSELVQKMNYLEVDGY